MTTIDNNGRALLSPLVDLKVAKLASSDGTVLDTLSEAEYMKNFIVDSRGAGQNQENTVKRRPFFKLVESAPASPDDKGRGITFREANSRGWVYAAGNEVFKNTYSNSLGTITAGPDNLFPGKVYFAEVGTYLTITDPYNAEAWTVDSSDTLAQISDGDFPSTLAGGNVTLNGRMFVMNEGGDIYQSDIDDPTAWAALETLNAERNPDGGTYLAKQRDHVIAVGPRTLEFFYDAANASGSVLTRRSDLFYNTGALKRWHVWDAEDALYFVGREGPGSIGVYTLSNFEVKRISNSSIDNILHRVIQDQSFQNVVLSGMSWEGRDFVLLTVFGEDSPYEGTSYFTFVYDSQYDTWGIWGTNLSTIGTASSIALLDLAVRTDVVGNAVDVRGIFSGAGVYNLEYDNVNSPELALIQADEGAFNVPHLWVVDLKSREATQISSSGTGGGGTIAYDHTNDLVFLRGTAGNLEEIQKFDLNTNMSSVVATITNLRGIDYNNTTGQILAVAGSPATNFTVSTVDPSDGTTNVVYTHDTAGQVISEIAVDEANNKCWAIGPEPSLIEVDISAQSGMEVVGSGVLHATADSPMYDSTNNRVILFLNSDGGFYEAYSFSVSTSTFSLLGTTDTTDFDQGRVLPGGQEILYGNDSTLSILNLDSLTSTQLLSGPSAVFDTMGLGVALYFDAGGGESYTCEIIFGDSNFGTNLRKFCREARLLGSAPTLDTPVNINLSWVDGGNTGSFSTARTIDFSDASARLTRLGSFRQRNFRLTYNTSSSDDSVFYLNGLELFMNIGSN